MPIISFLNPKGGSGKTTLATNVAAYLHRQNKKTLLVDTDPQGSARDWHAVQEENTLPLIALDRANNLRNIPNMSGDYDFVIVDGAAKLEDMIAASIKVSDLIIIPVQPSPYDIWAASDLVELVKARQEVTDGKPKTAFVITRTVSNTKLGEEIYTAVSEYGLSVLKSGTVQRQVYPRTASDGLTVFDSDNKPSKEEIQNITDEILSILSKN